MCICHYSLILLVLIGTSCVKQQTDSNASSADEAYFIKNILADGQGDFDPWNRKRWAEWYNEEGEIIRHFDIDTSVRFMSKSEPWAVKFSDEYTFRDFFIIAKQGITMDGNGIVLDVRTEKQRLPLEALANLKKEPWGEGNEIRGIFYQLPEEKGTPPTEVRHFTFMGWKRGIKINGTRDQEEHRLLVDSCTFTRNRVGFYTNGYNTMVNHCQFFENGYGAIYSGSGSARNDFIANTFRDNTLSQHQHSYGDFIGDTFSESVIYLNKFERSQISADHRRVGISMFRNMGEGNKLRKQIPHMNRIHDNHFDGYSVAIHVGARMGRDTRNDVTGEGRDYALLNHIYNNSIENTAIGIKVNTEGNRLSENKFKNVQEEIVLHDVFFELGSTWINEQENTEVKIWYVLEDYKEYAGWFKFQDDLNGSISRGEKLVWVWCQQCPSFDVIPDKNFQLNPDFEGKSRWFDYRAGDPLLVDKGELMPDFNSTEEYAAIYDHPVSRVDDQDYYSIVIYNSFGMEINRSGTSQNKWKQIAVGYFTRKSGEMEIAAVSGEPIDGKYPVFIFDRGYRIPKDTIYSDNSDPGITISTNDNSELEVLFL